MRNEGKGGEQRGRWGCPAERVVSSRREGPWGVTRGTDTHGMGSGHPGHSWQLEPGMLLEKGCPRIAASTAAPQEGRGSCLLAACRFSLPGASCFPGGTSSGSGNREFYSGCSSECTKGKGFRSRSQKLPHFSLSQMMVSTLGVGGAGRGVGGQAGGAACSRGGAGRGCITLRCLLQWKACSSPPTCLSSPLAGPYQN